MPILETILTLIAALIAFYNSLTPEQKKILQDIIGKAFEAMFGAYFDWHKGGPEGEPA